MTLPHVTLSLPNRWLTVNRLQADDCLEVRLSDGSVYFLQVVDPVRLHCLMREGGKDTPVYIMGSYVERAIQLGAIGVGYLLELVQEGNGRFCSLFPVEEVWVNGARVLPQ